MENEITINKNEAMASFFSTYAGDIEGSLKDMDQDELRDYLENDIFVACASAATGISEESFIEFAVENAGNLY